MLKALCRRGGGQGLRDTLKWLSSLYKYTPLNFAYLTAYRPGGAVAPFEIVTKYYHLYANRHNWLVNLGYSAYPITQATVTFDRAGVYHFDSLEVIAQPLSELPLYVKMRQLDSMDIRERTNVYEFTTTMDRDGYFFTTIPWSKGWSATIDGEPIEPIRADIAFMGIPLSQGRHVIRFSYTTPELLPGLGLSACGVAMLAGITVYRRKRLSPRAVISR